MSIGLEYPSLEEEGPSLEKGAPNPEKKGYCRDHKVPPSRCSSLMEADWCRLAPNESLSLGVTSRCLLAKESRYWAGMHWRNSRSFV